MGRALNTQDTCQTRRKEIVIIVQVFFMDAWDIIIILLVILTRVLKQKQLIAHFLDVMKASPIIAFGIMIITNVGFIALLITFNATILAN